MAHPLDPLTADEIRLAIAAVRATGQLTDAARFAQIALDEPVKGAPDPDRRAAVTIVTGPEVGVVEAVVSLTTNEVVAWEVVPDVRPALLFEESYWAIEVVKADPDWIAALAKRGITDLSRVQVDPWPAGTFGVPHEDGRRISRVLAYVRESPEDNGYARPIEGVIAFVDQGRREMLEVIDYGVTPIPTTAGSYYPADNGPLRTDLKPLEIHQPEGASFTLDGNAIAWQKWSLRVTMHPAEGLVLHEVAYDGRSVLHRGSVAEMVVPYGDPGPMHGWKNAFDAGEWGLGRCTNSLKLGCDCLGEITYLDAVFASELGDPYPVENAICIHEEDYGILWKHTDMHSGTVEVRRSRRLVVSHIATVGNYEYGFYWYFYLDGTLQLEVKLTGVMSTMAIEPGTTPRHATVIAPGLAAPVHQHLFNVRLDLDIDGTANSVYEVEADALPPGDDNPWGNAFVATARRLDSEQQAIRDVAPQRSRVWKVVNESVTNAHGQPVGYKLLAGASPTLLGDPSSSVGRRAGFAAHNVWVTPYAPDERRAAGPYPNQSPGGDGLPAWTAADRSLVDTDLVLWHTFGVTHIPRPEDWPVMPVEYAGFSLIPVGFFDRNPALDVPPTEAKHCH